MAVRPPIVAQANARLQADPRFQAALQQYRQATALIPPAPTILQDRQGEGDDSSSQARQAAKMQFAQQVQPLLQEYQLPGQPQAWLIDPDAGQLVYEEDHSLRNIGIAFGLIALSGGLTSAFGPAAGVPGAVPAAAGPGAAAATPAVAGPGAAVAGLGPSTAANIAATTAASTAVPAGISAADFFGAAALPATAATTAGTMPGAAAAVPGIVGPGMAAYRGQETATTKPPSTKTLGIPNALWPYIMQLGGSALAGAFAPDYFQRREGFPGAAATQADIGSTIKGLLGTAVAKSQEPVRLQHAGVPAAPPGYNGPSLPMRIGLNTPTPGYLQNQSTATAGPGPSPTSGPDPQAYGAAQLLLHALKGTPDDRTDRMV